MDTALRRNKGRRDPDDPDESDGDNDNDDEPNAPEPGGNAQEGAGGNNLKAMGNLPTIFTGEQNKAEQFINEIRNYMRVNRGVPGFNSAKLRVALALTVIQGPRVEGWARDIGTWINHLNQPGDDVEDVWIQFLSEFKDQFHDSSKEQHA